MIKFTRFCTLSLQVSVEHPIVARTVCSLCAGFAARGLYSDTGYAAGVVWLGEKW